MLTKQFEASILSHGIGVTVTHAAIQAQAPATTVERIFKRWMETESKHIQIICKQQDLESKQLVFGNR
jgi:hypothetical protein